MLDKWSHTAIAARTGTRVRWLPALLALVVLALLGSAGLASAHTELIASDPADGAELATSPARVVLTFNQPVQSGFSTVTVTGPSGDQWQASTPTEDGTAVSAPVRPLGPVGQYIIAYQVLSADGHPVRGALRFTLTTPGAGIAAAQQDGPSEPSPADRPDSATQSAGADAGSSGTPVWPWVAGAGVLLAAGVVVATRIGRSG